MRASHSKHKNKSGVSLTLCNEVSQRTKAEQDWFLVVKRWIFCYLATVLPIHCFYISMKAEINTSVFYIGIAIFLTVHFIGYLLKGKIRVLYQFALFLLIVSFIYLEKTLVMNGFYTFENIFLKRCEERFKISTWRYLVKRDPINAFTAFLMVCAVVFAIIVVQEVMRQCVEILYFLCCLVMLGIIVFAGLTPERGSFLSVLIICFMMVTMENASEVQVLTRERNIVGKRKMYTEKVRMQTACLGAALFLFSYFMVSLAFSKETFQTKINLKGPRTFLNERCDDIVLKLKEFISFSKSDTDFGRIASGGLRGGMLNGVSQISFDGSTQLYVSADAQTDFLYLKGYAGTFYTENRWISLSKGMREDYESLLSQYSDCTVLAETLVDEILKQIQQQGFLPNQFSESAVRVSYEAANQKYLYAPYFNDFQTCSIRNSCDLFAYPKNPTDRYFFGNVFTSKSGLFDGINDESAFIVATAGLIHRENTEFYQFERAYRDYVDKYYRTLPKTGLSRLKKVVFTSQKEGVEKTQDLISQVISYLSNHTRYSLSPGKVPEDVDFVENFLFFTHKGYCAHYATAAVLLLRNSGVPARYCEGYLVSKEDFISGAEDEIIKVAVPDSSAHAWIEVYYDGIGWLPYEVTKGYSVTDSNKVSKEIKKVVSEKETREQPKVTKGVSEVSKGDLDRGVMVSIFSQAVMGTGRLILLVFLGVVILFSVGIWIIHGYMQRKIKKRLHFGDRRRRVITYYLLMERIFKYLKIQGSQSMGDYEYMRSVPKRVDWLPDSYQKMIDIVIAACYGEKEPSIDEVLMVKGCYEEILHHFLLSKPVIVRKFIKYRYNLVE